MDTLKLIARLREHAATQDAAGAWSLHRAAADELERLWQAVGMRDMMLDRLAVTLRDEGLDRK